MNDKASTTITTSEEKTPTPPSKLACGIVMPISPQPGCTAEHWAEVRSIIEDAVTSIIDIKFDARLVSDADDVGVIQKRIVQNIYSSEIIVCDVSCKNSNVMFELGMRLAFDKPTVIIKDDQTDYSFDTGIIEHLTYPRDLRFSKIVLFKKALADKIKATYIASLDAKNSTFLKNFGTFNVASLTQADASPDQMVLEMLGELQSEMGRMRTELRRGSPKSRNAISTNDSRRDVQALMYAMIGDYVKNNGIKVISDLEKDGKFIDWVESQLPAGSYFNSRKEFLSELIDAVKVYDLF